MHLLNNQLLIFIVTATLSTLFLVAFLVALVLISKNKLNRRKREYLQALIKENEATMSTISMELHDNQTQMLNLARMTVHLIADEVNERGSEHLNAVALILDKLIIDTQSISHFLNTDYVKVKGLIASLQEELVWINNTSSCSFHCQMKTQGTVRSLPGLAEIMVFRIIQEAISNVVKYADARLVTINLHYAADSFTMVVADDGKGFNLDDKFLKTGLGTITMKQRAHFLNAKLEIFSAIGKGTCIRLDIPDAFKMPVVELV